jgi:BirA family biotin operon repressor/biotin-[acetyl-CoA-carboxylase] ligase
LYKIPAKTLFLGKVLVYVPQCHSTNSLAAELSQKEEPGEGTLVITDDQTAGKGQRGNSWESEPGKNLTFSVILKPGFLQAKEQFQINRVISLGIADFLVQKGIPEVSIKWPNDILIAEKKICGILIENHVSGNSIHYSIAGIGLNVNQQYFTHPKASSVRLISGHEYLLNDELHLLLGCLEARYLELKARHYINLEDDYSELLYRRNETHKFISMNEEFEGTITGVDEVGRLRIKINGEEKVFGVKEISFL